MSDTNLSKDFSGSLGPLLVVSGATGIAYEVLWARDFALLFGATAVGAAVVLAATFGGLALGAWLGGCCVMRARTGVSSESSAADLNFGLRFYAFLELAIALAIGAYVLSRPGLESVAAVLAQPGLQAWRPALQAAFAGAVLLVPSALLGATLPAAAAALAPADGAGAARLYAWNSLGGAVGALGSVAIALPVLGVRGTYLAGAGLDVVVGGIALVLARRSASRIAVPLVRRSSEREPLPSPVSPPGSAVPRVSETARARGGSPRRRGLGLLVTATTGFVGLACEVLWLRGLSGVLSNSVYSFALVLAAVLLGIVLGAALATALLRRSLAIAFPVSLAASALALTILGSGLALAWVPELSLAFAQAVGVHTARTGLAVEALLCVLVILPAAVALGALFPLALALVEPRAPSWAVGTVLAANTAGAVIGSLSAAFLLLPRVGLGGGLLAVAGLAAVLAVLAAVGTRALAAAVVTAAVVVAVAGFAPRLDLRWRTEGSEEVVFVREGAAATVFVTSDGAGRKRLRVNGQYSLGGTSGLLLERRQAHLPLLLHPAPREVLALGVGTADTLGAAVAHPGVTAEGVELLPEVLEAAALFADENRGAVTHPRVRLIADDARSHLLGSRRRYDVIVSDLFLPWTAGTAHLYSRELYLAGRSHLRPGGLFAQWLPLHQLAVVDLKAILATFLDVFPRVQLWLAYHRSDTPLGLLVGSEQALRVDAAGLRARLADPELARSLRSAGFVDPGDLAPLYVASEQQLAGAVVDAPIITDDRPVLEFSAPAAYFRQPALAREALAWIGRWSDPADAPVAGAPAGSGSAELRAALLEAQLALLAGDRPAELERYLEALALSPETRAVRQALYGVTRERLAAGDASTARMIADWLVRTAPASDETRLALALLQKNDDFTNVQ